MRQNPNLDEGIVDAAEMGHERVTHVPWAQVGVQAFNLGCLVALLVYLLRRAVKAHFAGRARDYGELVARAENARVGAERAKSALEEKLRGLERDAEAQEQGARREAERLGERLRDEAEALSAKVMTEARASIASEITRAKANLRAELLAGAIEASRKEMLGLTESTQAKLRAESAERMGTVRA